MTYQRTIRKEELTKIIKRAMRLGVWFRIDPLKRLILKLASQTLKIIKSPVIIQLIDELLDLLHPSRRFLREAWEIGYKILRKRVEQALMLGNKKAVNWLKNKKLILAYGITYLNTPPYYKTEI
ncbi:MAG: hypothetical protein J7K82_08460 [Thermoproteales archaeon]|nr:hypothetical protein [Thermoproteales archaeon]